MSDLKSLALRVAVLKTLDDQITKASTGARAALLEQMKAAGVEKVSADLPGGGPKVASVTLAGGHKVTAVVVDEAALLAWVREHHPHQLEERIRPAYRKALLDELSGKGEEIPGAVELTLTTAYLSNRFVSDGKDVIASAWADGALVLSEMLTLPAGGDGDAAS